MDFFYSSKNIKQKASESFQRCIDCKACMKNCPMLDVFCSSPKELWGRISADEKLPLSLPYSCTLCTYCSYVCPKGLEFEDVFYQMRKEIFSSGSINSKSLSKGLSIVKNHQKLSFSKHFTSVRGHFDSRKFKVGFIPGCSLVSYRPELISEIFGYLLSHFEDAGVILHCCGNPTSTVGDVHLFSHYYGTFKSEIIASGCDTIITACPNCYRTISKNSPDINVVSLWDVMAEKGLPKDMAKPDNMRDLKFSIHDPCPTRKIPSIHDSIRKLCSKIGIDTVEFKSNKAKTPCCGQGGMVGLTNPPIAARQMKKRAMQSSEDCILTYCQACAESMQIGGSKTLHILDILFPPAKTSTEPNQKRPGFLGKWINRYKGKLISDKI